MKSPRAHDPGVLKSAAACHRPWLNAPALHVRWRTHHGPGARAAVSVAGCGSTVVASCDRLRRFLRLGLGPGFSQMIRSLGVSVRLSRHTERGNREATDYPQPWHEYPNRPRRPQSQLSTGISRSAVRRRRGGGVVSGSHAPAYRRRSSRVGRGGRFHSGRSLRRRTGETPACRARCA